MVQKWITVVILTLIVIGIGFYFFGKNTTPHYSENSTTVVPNFHTLTFTNTSDYLISPGLLVVHRGSNLLNFLAEPASSELERLAEEGDPSELLAQLQREKVKQGIYQLHEVAMIEPGERVSVAITEDTLDAKISYMGMIVQTNDGLVWINSVDLFPGGRKATGVASSELLDAGTEANAPIGSGFSGGQPDPSRGEANVNNGTSTTESVRHHAQFYDDPSRVTEFFSLSFE